MEQTRKRNESFHEDFENNVDGPPKYIPSDTSLNSDSIVDNDPPTRSRSKSVHANDPVGPPRPVQLIDPNLSTKDSPENKLDKIERSNQLNVREVKALKMGLEQATAKNKQQQKEEEDEKRAAELEKKKRSTIASPTAIGNEPLLRRFKILLLGDSGVGKSSLICRWTLDAFNPTLLGTVGVDFKAKKVCIDGENLQIQVWDTAGQEQFHKITTSYYKGANGIMLVYDVTDEKSAQEVSYWMKNIKTHATENVSVVMVANKVDLLSNVKETPILLTGKNNAKKYDVQHFLTSAKDSSGVDDAFINLVRLILNSEINIKPKSHLTPPSSAILKANSSLEKAPEKNSPLSGIFNRNKGKSNGGTNGSEYQSSSTEKQGKEKCLIS